MLRVNIDRGYYVLVGLSRGLRSHLHFFFCQPFRARAPFNPPRTEDIGPNHSLSGLNGTEWHWPRIQPRFGWEPRTGKSRRTSFQNATQRDRVGLSRERDTCCICNTFFTCCSFVFHFLVRKEQRSPGFAPHLGRRSSPVRSSPTRFNSHRRQ